MHLEVLLEEESCAVALDILLPRIVPDVSFQLHAFQGKDDLLAKLPPRLAAYRHWIPDDFRILVVIDEDRADCIALKQQLEVAALGAGFETRSSQPNSYTVLNRIAVEELESWFFGDMPALCDAFARVPTSLASRAGFRDPDAISGGTWEALERVLQRAGHYAGGLAKIDAARKIAAHMDPDRNGSRSFCLLRDGLRELAAAA